MPVSLDTGDTGDMDMIMDMDMGMITMTTMSIIGLMIGTVATIVAMMEGMTEVTTGMHLHHRSIRAMISPILNRTFNHHMVSLTLRLRYFLVR
jgi:hypothetical protein